jgi:hypothetical protein
MEVISPAPREKQPKTSKTGKKKNQKSKISKEDQKIWKKTLSDYNGDGRRRESVLRRERERKQKKKN